MNTDTPETDAMVSADQHHLEDDNFFPASIYWRMCDLARTLERERDEAREYADKLAEGLPDGMLPKDVEVLREANLGLATNIAVVTEQRDAVTLRLGNTQERMFNAERQRDGLAEALRVATAYPLTESWYKKAIEALATLKPCD